MPATRGPGRPRQAPYYAHDARAVTLATSRLIDAIHNYQRKMRDNAQVTRWLIEAAPYGQAWIGSTLPTLLVELQAQNRLVDWREAVKSDREGAEGQA